MMASVFQSSDQELIDELEARGYIIIRNTKASVDMVLPMLTEMLKGIGYTVLPEGLPEHAVWYKYRSYDLPIADQPALDLWKAAVQGDAV